jgi:hypothetical protein
VVVAAAAVVVVTSAVAAVAVAVENATKATKSFYNPQIPNSRPHGLRPQVRVWKTNPSAGRKFLGVRAKLAHLFLFPLVKFPASSQVSWKMKLPIVFAVIIGMSAHAFAQDAVFVAPEVEELPVEEVPVERRAQGLQGIIAQILRVAQPLQLINPFAPSYYGTGEENVSKDDSFGQSYFNQPGLKVFGAEFE